MEVGRGEWEQDREGSGGGGGVRPALTGKSRG